MGGKKNWTILSFLICFICNGVLVGFFLTSRNLLGEYASGGSLAFAGVILTSILWLLLLRTGRVLAKQVPSLQVFREVSPSGPPPPASDMRPSPESAIQMLSALQREGRLIDFLQEDIAPYEDGQIGAAVRNIHAGCKEALREHMEIKPVYEENEGKRVTVPPKFDVKAIRLMGNVTGNPPFSGVLRHRGWKVVRIRLPGLSEQKNQWILSPAEVEIE